MVPKKPRILIYILRRDVRLSDNPVFQRASLLFSNNDAVSSSSEFPKTHSREDSLILDHDLPDFTHLLPVYIFLANQVEVSGFLSSSADISPYPEARSQVAGIWRTGPHRAKFIAEGVWDLKERLEGLGCGSGLHITVGMMGDVLRDLLDWYAVEKDGDGTKAEVAGIWITNEEGTEEKDDEEVVRNIANERGINFKVWEDEKYYIDECVSARSS